MTLIKSFLGAVMVTLALFASGEAQTVTKILYRVSARNLPTSAGAFAKIQEGRPFPCNTDTVSSANPDWSAICQLEFRSNENDMRLTVEVWIRLEAPIVIAVRLGFAVFFVRDMLEHGRVLIEEIRDNADPKGNFIVIVACVPGTPGCALSYDALNKTHPELT